MAAGTVRVDSWLWAVRVFKTRSQATAACRAGHVKIGGASVKAAQAVKIGDQVRVRISGFDRILVVKQTIVKRVSAITAAESFIDETPPPPSKEEIALAPRRDRGAGRPTKRERRELEKLRGRDELDSRPRDD
ncbi:RNA-binding S4 domain-containing protein [Salinibacterium sp. TMP30]|uniref:RNA-binding S4 domain-containing protein n=1 Tax=Salinibacterium sp. TMP30 TaxID=3138237 RepID=UPI0031386D86